MIVGTGLVALRAKIVNPAAERPISGIGSRKPGNTSPGAK
jgi:hypothetical protein